MNFNPPANARVITAQELNDLESKLDVHSGQNLSFNGPLLIKGDIADKSIHVAGGGLWVDGSASRCNMFVAPKDIRSLTPDTLWPSLEKAAQEGVGLYVCGSLHACEHIAAPNIEVGKDIIAGCTLPPDPDMGIVYPNHIVAGGGHLHVEGDIIGQRNNSELADKIKVWHETKATHPQGIMGKTLEEGLKQTLDNIFASGDLLVKGKVQDATLISKAGRIVPGNRQAAWVLTEDKTGTKILHTPEMDKGPLAGR